MKKFYFFFKFLGIISLFSIKNYYCNNNLHEKKNKEIIESFVMKANLFDYLYEILDDKNIFNEFQCFKNNNSLTFLKNLINSDIFEHFIKNNFFNDNENNNFKTFLKNEKQLHYEIEKNENENINEITYTIMFHKSSGIKLMNFKDKKNNQLLKVILFKVDHFYLDVIIEIYENKIISLKMIYHQTITNYQETVDKNNVLQITVEQNIPYNLKRNVKEDTKSVQDNFNFILSKNKSFFSFGSNKDTINKKNLKYITSTFDPSLKHLHDKIKEIINK